MKNDEEDSSISFPRRLKYLAVLNSFVCGVLIIIHAVYPQFSIDTTTIALIIIMIFPWLLPYIRAIKLPGGTEVTFKEEVRRLEQLSEKSQISKISAELQPPPSTEPTRWTLFKVDPNLALASLRIDIEKVLRKIASQRNIQVERVPLRKILYALHYKKIIGSSEFKTLNLIIDICNKAVHAEKVDASTASRILDIGESILLYLYSIKENE